MKVRILALSLVLFASFATQAQIIKGGVNFANISISDDGDVDENKTLTTFQVGITGDIRIVPFLFFQPGILFTGKGSKTQSGETTDATYFRATSNPLYVEIPANFVLKTPGPIRFFAGAGPYLAVGVAGHNEVEGKFLGVAFKNETDIEFSNDDPTTVDYEEGAGYGIVKRFDYGLNALVGIQTAGIVFSLNYGHGLAKLQSGDGSGTDDKNKHRVVSLTVGIKL